ncbi:pentatricopeptide repeat-containing protein At4g38150-like [Benincasa hispida]|uniref:pentatricopeptide repeat-containing protein At4g38150-like n=1 Tax=Benincasa hispida TaxID=102211 RepID=UPI001900CE1F|nr:pentatricopeptide repeat-containing protein At4g38150-like [Benincasa hispida]
MIVKYYKRFNHNHSCGDIPPEANEIFRKMKETGLIIPYAVAMLDGLCKDGLIQEAMKLFALIREKGTIPEVVIYTAVVDGFCKAEKLDGAIRIFRKMQNNGIPPNAFSSGVLIQGLYKCKKLEDVVAFCIEMLEFGHSPNLNAFVGLIDELCNEKGVDEAHIVVETLKQKGFLINEKALRELLNKRAPFSPHVWEVVFGKKNKKEFFHVLLKLVRIGGYEENDVGNIKEMVKIAQEQYSNNPNGFEKLLNDAKKPLIVLGSLYLKAFCTLFYLNVMSYLHVPY